MRFSTKKRGKHTYLGKLFLLASVLFVAFLLRYLIFSYNHILGYLNHPSTQNTRTALDQLIDETDLSTSLYRILKLLHQQTKNSSNQNTAIDPEVEKARCKKYGYRYDGRTQRRRIFYGSPIADDSWHAIAAHAIEAYDLYHTVAFAESDVTTSDREQFIKPRTLRFPPGSFALEVMQSGIFGPSTKVYVDQYVDDRQKRIGVESKMIYAWQEDLQRDVSLKRFIDNGMTKEDIAIFSDVDESFTRDFLLAAQLCDIPQFRPGQNCQKPKIVSKTLIFESAPDCITSNRVWFHPDMMIGECVDEIGDSTLHKPAKRLFGDKGRRLPENETPAKDYKEIPDNFMYPLWRPVDSRVTEGGDLHFDKDDHHIGFHFRNFFESMDILRHKFHTFTHATPNAWAVPIGEIHEDLNMTVNCLKRIRDDENAGSKALKGGFGAIQGPTPLAFQDPIYRHMRFEEAKAMLYLDEKKINEKLNLVNEIFFKTEGEDTG